MNLMDIRRWCVGLVVVMLIASSCTKDAGVPSKKRALSKLGKELARHGSVMYRADASRSGIVNVRTSRPKKLTRVHHVVYEQAPVALGDHLLTVGSDVGLYSTESETFVWTRDVGRASASAFSRGIAYVNTLEGDVFALDAGSGTIVWRSSTDESFDERKAGLTEGELDRLYSGASPIPSPAISNRSVYVANGEGEVLALDQQTGDLDWQYNVGAPVHVSVAVSGNRVFAASSKGVLAALNAETGEVIWTKKISEAPPGVPVAVDGRVFVAIPKTSVIAFEVETGRKIWSTPLKHSYTVIASDGRRVYMTSGGGVNAVDASSGSLVWRWAFDECGGKSRGGIIPPGLFCPLSPAEGAIFGPTVSRNAVHVATVNEGIRSIDRATGKLLWKFVIPRTGGVSEPVIASNAILIFGIGGGGGYLAALR